MRHQVRFWWVSFIILSTSGNLRPRALFLVNSPMTDLAAAVVLPLHTWLLAQALSQNAQQTVLQTLVAKRSTCSSQNCSSRNTSCRNSSRSNSRFRGTTPDSSYAHSLDVSNISTTTRSDDEYNSSHTILCISASSGASRLHPQSQSFRRPTDQCSPSASGEHVTAHCRLLGRLRRTLSGRRPLTQTASQSRPQMLSQPQPQTPPVSPGIQEPRKYILRNSSFTRDLATTDYPPANLVEILEIEEASCQRVRQAIVAIDGGSSKTQPSLFSVLTESCPEGKDAGRHTLVDTLQFVGDGGKFLGVRQLVERWLQHVVRQQPEEPKQPLEITEYQKDLLQRGFPSLEHAADELVNQILVNMVQLIETNMSELEQREAKSLSIPVIFHSTAGLRDVPSWYREGLFLALRRAINSAPSVKGFVFFTNHEFTRPISGQTEAICAFLTANYLLGNLATLREHQRAVDQEGAARLLLKALHRRGYTLRKLRQERVARSLKPEFTDEGGVGGSLHNRFPDSAGVGSDGDNKTPVSELACTAGDCSATSPFLDGISITRCRSGVPDIRFCAHGHLAAIIESGGASMQIAFPVRRLDLLPRDMRIHNLQRSGFLSDDYPPTDVVAVSFMQLGSNSAGGLFLKLLCAADSPYVSNGKVCINPCFHKNYAQPCSAGQVIINDTGEVTVLGDALHNRLRPAAVFCGEDNAEVLVKTSTEVECRASNFDPLAPLRRRLEIPNCRRIVGSGDFDKCVEAVTQLLIEPQFPLPANREAVAAGFENPSQIFSFFSSRAPLLITGNSLVIPMRTLQTAGFLPQGELLFAQEDIARIEQASREYCRTPLIKDSTGGLRLGRNGTVRTNGSGASETRHDSTSTDAGVEATTLEAINKAAHATELNMSPAVNQHGSEGDGVREHKGIKIDSLNYENCQRLATIVALLRSIYKGAESPSHVLFATELQAAPADNGGTREHGRRRPASVEKLGWQTGTILRYMMDETRWRQWVYELGAAHSLHDRLRREENGSGAETGVW